MTLAFFTVALPDAFRYLITLSARTNTFGGIVRPICLAAFEIDHELKFCRLLHWEDRRAWRLSESCPRT